MISSAVMCVQLVSTDIHANINLNALTDHIGRQMVYVLRIFTEIVPVTQTDQELPGEG